MVAHTQVVYVESYATLKWLTVQTMIARYKGIYLLYEMNTE